MRRETDVNDSPPILKKRSIEESEIVGDRKHHHNIDAERNRLFIAIRAHVFFWVSIIGGLFLTVLGGIEVFMPQLFNIIEKDNALFGFLAGLSLLGGKNAINFMENFLKQVKAINVK
jgi:hypothetical protein